MENKQKYWEDLHIVEQEQKKSNRVDIDVKIEEANK